MESIVSKAAIFAAKAHDGQRRKAGGGAYILHPLEAAVIVASLTDDEDVIAAALLHDTIEDTDVTAEQLLAEFGPVVTDLVLHETEDKHREMSPADSWKMRKQATLDALEASGDRRVLCMWMGDKLSNLRSMRREYDGPAFFDHFNQKDPAQHAWYYREILRLLAPLGDTDAYREMAAIVDELFGRYAQTDGAAD